MSLPTDNRQEYNRQYREKNRDVLLQKKKEYREKNRDKINQEKKEHYMENSEELIEKSKKYYNENKDKIRAYQNEKITCECGCIISRGKISNHRKTNKHLNIMKVIIPTI